MIPLREEMVGEYRPALAALTAGRDSTAEKRP